VSLELQLHEAELIRALVELVEAVAPGARVCENLL
jgi:hypothetical protein